MARGATAKSEITKKIFEVYPNAFMDGKIIRIPFTEDGEPVEIKVTLTAAKDVMGGGAPVASTTSAPADNPPWSDDAMNPPEDNGTDWKMTDKEKAETANIMKELGL